MQCFFSSFFTLHNIQLTPQKLSAWRKNHPGAPGAGVWPEDQVLHRGRNPGRRRYKEVLPLEFLTGRYPLHFFGQAPRGDLYIYIYIYVYIYIYIYIYICITRRTLPFLGLTRYAWFVCHSTVPPSLFRTSTVRCIPILF